VKGITLVATVSVAMLVATQCAGDGANGTKEKEAAGLHELAQRLLDSLKDDDIIAYSQCWITWPEALRCAKKHGPPPAMLKKHRQFMLERDRTIAKLFQAVRSELSRLTPHLSDIKVDSMSGPIEEDKDTGALISHPLVLRICVNTSSFVEWEMLGVKVGEDWCLSGAPESKIKVIRNGKPESVDLDP
jgi:hypothetical protein